MLRGKGESKFARGFKVTNQLMGDGEIILDSLHGPSLTSQVLKW